MVTEARPDGVLARLPLQIGTSATWNVTGAALTLLPSIAVTFLPCAYLGVRGLVASAFVTLTITAPFVVYAIASMVRARRHRASDVLLHADGVVVVGGPMHGRRIRWNDLAPPFVSVVKVTEKRLRLGWMLLGAFMFVLFLAVLVWQIVIQEFCVESLRLFGTPWKRKEIDVWQLWIIAGRERILAATTEEEIEASSMTAAAESIEAVVSGRRYVEQAPAVAAQVISCQSCGAPQVPEDADAVVCPYCRNPVPMLPYARQQAAATRAMSESRGTGKRIVQKLLQQPPASRINVRLTVFAVMMFLVWPVAWAVIAPHVIADGWDMFDIPVLLLPFVAVLGWSFLARAQLADRGALQLLTLGFGALAPRRQGEPPRCRRCQGPLPPTEVGGVVACRYCGADNVVGLDLRPVVGPARAEQATLEHALAKRASEKTKWGLLSGVAVAALLVWIGATTIYLAANIGDDSSSRPVPAPAKSSPVPSSPAPKPSGIPVRPRR